jgi:membrane-associated protease RseP (regulator of RpoE activity)
MGTQPISVLPENALTSTQNSYLMPTVNFLFTEGFISGDLVSTPAKIERVSASLLGQKMGLTSGDTVLSINNTPVDVWNIGGVLKENIDKDITLIFERNHKKILTKEHCPVDNCIL